MEGKVVLVSGAGSIGSGWGNGKASAVLFAREGGKVFAVDRDLNSARVTQRIIENEGGRCLAYEADVTDPESVDAMVNQCCQEFGQVDVLYNNVGRALAGGIMELDEAAWDGQMNVNLKHVFLVVSNRSPIKLLRRRFPGLANRSRSNLPPAGFAVIP